MQVLKGDKSCCYYLNFGAGGTTKSRGDQAGAAAAAALRAKREEAELKHQV